MNATKKIRFSLDPITGTLSDDDARRYFSRIGFATAALIVINIAVQILLATLVARLAPAWYSHPITQNLLAFLPLYLAAFPIFLTIVKPLPTVAPLKTPMGAKKWLGGLCASFAVMTLGNSLSQYLIFWLDVFLGRSLENPVESTTVGTPWYFNLIFIALLAPILEELFFRKLLCRYLLPLGEGYAILLSAAIFGLAHGNFFQFFYAFGLGCLFALVYVKTGNILYSMLYHIAINLLGGVFSPWLIERLDLENLSLALEEMLASQAPDPAILAPYALPLTLLLVYDVLVYGLAIIGAILLLRARRQHSLDAGLLPPPRKGRVGNLLLNTGVACAITACAGLFLLSLLP